MIGKLIKAIVQIQNDKNLGLTFLKLLTKFRFRIFRIIFFKMLTLFFQKCFFAIFKTV